ncbi:MAG: flagellar biosynthetic protein FliO [Spirochaetales bacterium]|nr:flagellar biosynthetic protein FliO [Spirochaetales bacterium]
MKLGRGTLKQLYLILIILGAPFFITAQESPGNSEFPQINEAELPLFPAETADEAGGDDTAPAAETAPPSVGLGDLIRVIIVLAGVIGVIYLLVYFLKKVSPMSESREERIGILATRHLKRDSSLHLVEVGNQVFLVGSGSSSVNIISEITDQETLDSIRLEQSEAPAHAPGSFRDLFRKGLSLGSGSRMSDQSPDFLRAQRDRLKNLGDRE